jgi:glycosyltransferase involved in cell wall biosynthesis
MKVLLCHNFYQQAGGEDQSFAAEAALLETHGHDVVRFTLHNDAIDRMSRWELVRNTFWNPHTHRDLRELIRRERPAVMHCTNTFPLISPAAYDAARSEGIPIVQSLRNYRLACCNSYLSRDGRVCQSCLSKRVGWAGIAHRCYRESRAASAVVVAMTAAHRFRGTWNDAVDVYFTPSQFAKDKLVEHGLPAEKIRVKPNFIDPDPGPGRGSGGYAVFVGRLSREKGIETLLEAWQQVEGALPLKIVGSGPLGDLVQDAAAQNHGIEWLGKRTPQDVLDLVGDATCLVMPSLWYETFGRTIIEAFSRGTPVIASRLGAMVELIDDGRTGWHFRPGDVADLVRKVRLLLQQRHVLPEMRREARGEYLEKYTSSANLQILLSIYEAALAGGHTSAELRRQADAFAH